MPQPTIVFDLDGTLIDTAPDLLASLNHCLEEAGLRQVHSPELIGFVGFGGRVMIEKAFAAQNRQLTKDEHDRLFESFINHYSNNMPGRSSAFPGAIDALDRFSSAGYALAICTNKFEAMAVRLLTELGVAHRFAFISGQDTFPWRKPDPRHLIDTIKRASGDASRSVMIGDSRTDIDTAKAAGIPIIAVDFGYSDRHVREFEPSAIISHFRELTLDLVGRLIDAAA